ncbi:MAG TPA: DinB family protein [Longimicrobiales bacterium]
MQHTALNIIQIAFGDFEQELKQTRRLLAAIPDGHLDWRPHEKSYTLGGLAQHVAQMPGLVVSIIRDDQLDFATVPRIEKPNSVQDILSIFDESAAAARAAFSELTEDHLTRTWKFLYHGKELFTRPKAGLIRDFFLSHMIHHRAQLTVYIRLLGSPVPGLYGPSADEM